MFAFPSKESPLPLASVSQKLQFPAKAKPQSPYGLHRFSYTNEHNVSQTALIRTPSPNKEFHKVSSHQNVIESQVQSPDGQKQTRPRAMSAGSVTSVKSIPTQNTTQTAETINSSYTMNSKSSVDLSVGTTLSEGAVNRDLSRWFQTSTKDPKIAFMQSSLISVIKSTSRSSTPTRSLTSNASFSSTVKSTSSVISSRERLPLSTPHASSAWREQYQERGKERVEEFMQSDQIDYLGLAELADAPLESSTAGRSVNADGDGTESSGIEESGQLTLDQQRSLKDAQDGIISLQAMGASVLGNTRYTGSSSVTAIGTVSGSVTGMGKESISPRSRLGLVTDQAEQHAQELMKRRQRRILQLIKDFRKNNTVDVDTILSSQELENAGTNRRHQLIVAAKQAIGEAAHTFNEHTAQAAAQLAEYEGVLNHQNTHFFDLQQQLFESETQLVEAGEENRHLLSVMQEALKEAEKRVGPEKVGLLVSRYPQSWFDSSQQNNHNLYTDDTDADSVFMHLNNPPHLNNSGGTHKRRTSFSSNASMSELSTLTRNNNITYASKDTYHKYDNSPQKSTSPKNVNNMPSARSFSEPWVYNVNPTVVSTFGSPTSAGHRMCGSSFVERRAASPNPFPRSTQPSTTSSNNHYNNYNNPNQYSTSSNSVASRSTSASRSKSASFNRNSDDVSASSRSTSRGRSRYATINGPVPPSSIRRERSASTERRLSNYSISVDRRDQYGDNAITQHNHDYGKNSDSVNLGRAISKLESSRNAIHANNQKHSIRNNKSSSGPVSLLKQAADHADDTRYDTNNIYAASSLVSGAAENSSTNAYAYNNVHNKRRGSYDTVLSTDSNSNVSHLSVSTTNSHKNRSNYSSHPNNNTTNGSNTFPERSTLGLQRSPPLSAASHRHSSHNNTNSRNNRDPNRRRYSEVTDSTDANYSSIRHHDYALEDIHTDPSRPPVYNTHSNNSHTFSGDGAVDTQFYPIHYLDPDTITDGMNSDVIIAGKHQRGRINSPKASRPYQQEHINSSNHSSAGERDGFHSNENNNVSIHSSGRKNSSNTRNNVDESDSFLNMKAIDYINNHYRGQQNSDVNAQDGYYQRVRSASGAEGNTHDKQQHQTPAPWTLSKYNTTANTTANTSISVKIHGNKQQVLNTSTNTTANATMNRRVKTPQLAVYRGRVNSDLSNDSSAINSNKNNNNTSELRRATIPKVPVPAAAQDNKSATIKESEQPVYHNAAQADMAGYIESMRRRKV